MCVCKANQIDLNFKAKNELTVQTDLQSGMTLYDVTQMLYYRQFLSPNGLLCEVALKHSHAF